MSARIQYDLFHEIKKNGNERSLRICLNLFAYFCPFIKQRKIKPYAVNLMPCILTIAKRKETQLIEVLSEFVDVFAEHLLISLSENEVMKFVEAFINDSIVADCMIKRRCAASNVIKIVRRARRPALMGRHALNVSLGKFKLIERERFLLLTVSFASNRNTSKEL